MTFQQFLDKYDRKPLNPDGIYGQQCVDVIKQYFVDCLGIPAIRNNAVDYWTNYPTAHLTKIVNTPSFVPQKGDIVVWGTSVGQYGHIAIIIDANVNSFTSFDQNWPFDNGTGVAHFQWHNYTGVLGVLRPKKNVNFDQAAFDADVAEKARIASDRMQKEEAARVAAEQKKLAEEQKRLDAELAAKIAAEESARQLAELKAQEEAVAKALAEENAKKAEGEEVKDMNILAGYKTYSGILITVLGGLGAASYFGGVDQLTVFLDALMVVVGGLIALYGRYKARP